MHCDSKAVVPREQRPGFYLTICSMSGWDVGENWVCHQLIWSGQGSKRKYICSREAAARVASWSSEAKSCTEFTSPVLRRFRGCGEIDSLVDNNACEKRISLIRRWQRWLLINVHPASQIIHRTEAVPLPASLLMIAGHRRNLHNEKAAEGESELLIIMVLIGYAYRWESISCRNGLLHADACVK